MLPGWLPREPIAQKDEGLVLRVLAEREEGDSASHLGEPITTRESLLSACLIVALAGGFLLLCQSFANSVYLSRDGGGSTSWRHDGSLQLLCS